MEKTDSWFICADDLTSMPLKTDDDVALEFTSRGGITKNIVQRKEERGGRFFKARVPNRFATEDVEIFFTIQSNDIEIWQN